MALYGGYRGSDYGGNYGGSYSGGESWGGSSGGGRGGGGHGRGRRGNKGRHGGGGRGGGGRDGSAEDNGGGGGGRRGGKHPRGLRGKDIGMFYARMGRDKSKKEEIKSRPVVQLSEQKQAKIHHLLQVMRSSEYCTKNDPVPTEEDTSGLSEDQELRLSHIGDSHFKRQYLQNLKGNAIAGFRQENSSRSREVYTAIERDGVLDRRLKEGLEDSRRNSRKYKEMLRFREKLPAFDRQRAIVELVRKNQVVVISGETGCGKTTQVAQFILDDYIMAGSGSICRVICTQPRRISAISVAERVAEERGEICGENTVGYQIRLEGRMPRSQGSILFCTTGILLQWLSSDPLMTKVSHVILDEIHERDIISDFLITILKDLLPKRPDLKVILMSATLNADLFANYFWNCPSFNIPGFTFPVVEYYLEDVLEMTGFSMKGGKNQKPFYRRGRRDDGEKYEDFIDPYIRQLAREHKYSTGTLDSIAIPECEEMNLDLIATLVRYICTHEGEGAILVFLPGWDNISKLNQVLTDDPMFNSSRYRIIPLHSMMPTVSQKEVFQRPPRDVRKIVIATNIAETSITIDDVVFVVDCGKIKMKNFDEKHNITTLQPEWVSLANARQRRGRAGRVQPGICYHLYTKMRESTFEQFPVPEILRTRLEEVVLQIKLLQLGKVRHFLSRVMQSPSEDAIDLSLKMLETLNAIDKQENLTPLGFHLAQLPMDPQTAKMILMGAIFGCLDPILSVAASLSFKDPFVIPLGKEKEADGKRKELAEDTKSDHIVLARAMDMWEQEKDRSRVREREFCWHFFLAPSTLQLLHNMKGQFAEHLYRMRFLTTRSPKDIRGNQKADNLGLIKAIICAGLYPNVAKARKVGRKNPRIQLRTAEDGKVALHPKSVNEGVKEFESPFLMYHLKIKSSAVFLHDTTMVSPFPLIFFGRGVDFFQEEGQGTLAVDDHIRFRCERRTAFIVKELREELDKLLEYKISHPGVTNWNPQSKEGALLSAIVELITSEDNTLRYGYSFESDEEDDFDP